MTCEIEEWEYVITYPFCPGCCEDWLEPSTIVQFKDTKDVEGGEESAGDQVGGGSSGAGRGNGEGAEMGV